MEPVKRILVTGGSGFIGSHLCARLLHEGHEVICLDNFYTSTHNNIADLMDHSSFQLLRHDVREEIPLDIDEIYHLACPASPKHYQKNPIYTLKTSILGTINMLELARKVGAKILLASTSEVYGNAEVHPQTESYTGNVNIIGPKACYDEGKRCAETLVFDYHRKYNLDIRVIRIFNTYGPKMCINDGRVVSNFIVQALKGEDITLYGDGNQTRSFCYVDDLIEGMTLMMNNTINFKGPVNIGNPHEITIKELAQNIIKVTGSKSKITTLPLPIDDPVRRQPNISLAREKLGWEPKVTLAEGLVKTINYFNTII